MVYHQGHVEAQRSKITLEYGNCHNFCYVHEMRVFAWVLSCPYCDFLFYFELFTLLSFRIIWPFIGVFLRYDCLTRIASTVCFHCFQLPYSLLSHLSLFYFVWSYENQHHFIERQGLYFDPFSGLFSKPRCPSNPLLFMRVVFSLSR